MKPTKRISKCLDSDDYCSLSLHILLQFLGNIVTCNSSKITWVGRSNLRNIRYGPLTTRGSGYPLHILRNCFVIVIFVVVSGCCYGLQLSASKYWSNLSLIHRQLDIIDVFNWNYLAIGTFSDEVHATIIFVDMPTSVHEDTISYDWWACNLSNFVHCFMCVCVCLAGWVLVSVKPYNTTIWNKAKSIRVCISFGIYFTLLSEIRGPSY